MVKHLCEEQGEHKSTFDILHLVSDDIERYWSFNNRRYAYMLLLCSADNINEIQSAIAYSLKLLAIHESRKEKSDEMDCNVELGHNCIQNAANIARR